MSWFVYVIRVCGDEVSGDEPTPERQPLERESAARSCEAAELTAAQRGRESGFLATARRDAARGGKIGRGERIPPHFGPIHLQSFYRAEFGFKEGDFPVTEFAGRTSIAIPFHNHNHFSAKEVEYVAGVPERTLGERQ